MGHSIIKLPPHWVPILNPAKNLYKVGNLNHIWLGERWNDNVEKNKLFSYSPIVRTLQFLRNIDFLRKGEIIFQQFLLHFRLPPFATTIYFVAYLKKEKK